MFELEKRFDFSDITGGTPRCAIKGLQLLAPKLRAEQRPVATLYRSSFPAHF
jgi:hypothetical protein